MAVRWLTAFLKAARSTEMLVVRENLELYRYEIHSLVKAFYPKENVKVIVQGDPHAEKVLREQPAVFMDLTFLPDAMKIVIHSKGISEEKSVAAPLQTEAGAFRAEEVNAGAGVGQMPPAENAQTGFCTMIYSAALLSGAVKSRETRDALKTLLYGILSDFTGRELPWGDLIGIRPTKIAMTQIEEGRSDAEAAEFLMREHRVSGQKAQLAVDIANREKRILSNIHYENGYSLYIGIPFCPTTCLYCSFPSFNIGLWRDRLDEYVDALVCELEEAARIMEGKVLDTIYIGGGTPTALEAEHLDRICAAVESCFDLSTVQEFTVEAGRPDSITREKLLALHGHPVTRISVNPQTMKEETLQVIGRYHTVQQVIDTFYLARECGYDDINMDIILGLPGEGAEDVRNTVARIEELRPDSLTVHSLAVKKGSRLQRIIDDHGYPVFLNTDETMEIAAAAAAGMGMKPYYLYRQKNMSGNFENVGYAREGAYGLYNILIMEEKQTIMACGAGSITKRVFRQPDGSLRIERCEDAKDLKTYLGNLEEMLLRKRRLFA